MLVQLGIGISQAMTLQTTSPLHHDMSVDTGERRLPSASILAATSTALNASDSIAGSGADGRKPDSASALSQHGVADVIQGQRLAVHLKQKEDSQSECVFRGQSSHCAVGDESPSRVGERVVRSDAPSLQSTVFAWILLAMASLVIGMLI